MPESIDSFVKLALEVVGRRTYPDLPIGAVIVDGLGNVISSSRNQVIDGGDATAHAELLAIRQLPQSLNRNSASLLTLAVTLEPCPMCAWAIRLAGIGRVIFGAYNSSYGAAGSTIDLLRDLRFGRPVEVLGGILESECAKLLHDSFIEIRNNG